MGSAGGVEFRERLSDAMRPEDMDDGWPSETPSSDDGGGGGGGGSIEERAAPPSQQRARLWDGRGHFDDVPSGSGRSRHDREYSLGAQSPLIAPLKFHTSWGIPEADVKLHEAIYAKPRGMERQFCSAEIYRGGCYVSLARFLHCD